MPPVVIDTEGMVSQIIQLLILISNTSTHAVFCISQQHFSNICFMEKYLDIIVFIICEARVTQFMDSSTNFCESSIMMSVTLVCLIYHDNHGVCSIGSCNSHEALWTCNSIWFNSLLLTLISEGYLCQQ